ncbi:MAG TPA: slipin family protein [Flavipsychrobacter sp.]
MQTVKVKAYYKGLMYKNGRYVKMLNEGKYWVWGNTEIVPYDETKIYVAPADINVLMQDTALSAATTLVEVRDNERGIVFENGLYKQLLQPGKYVLWNSVVKYEIVKIDLDNVYINASLSRAVLSRPEIAHYLRVFTIEPFEKGLLYINGKFEKELGAGTYYFWKNDIQVAVNKVDIRLQQIEVNGQEILTKDKAVLRINFYARYRVTDITTAITNSKDMQSQLYTLLQLALREYVGGYTLDELLEKKNEIAAAILDTIKDKCLRLGLAPEDCGLKDIILPGDMKDIMNQVLIAEKRAQANTITRREETASTRSLLNTAKLMEENQMLFRLKEMEYVEKIAEKINGISVSGSGDLISQLSKIFVPGKDTNK